MENTQKTSGRIRKFLPLIITGSVLLAVVIAFFIFMAVTLSGSTIYEGITIGDVSVGNMTIEEAEEALADRYGNALIKTITLRCSDAEEKLDLISMGATIDPEQTVKAAYQMGRTGNIFARLGEVFRLKKEGATLPPTIYCNESTLSAAIDSVTEGLGTTAREMELAIGENELTITRGTPGLGIHRENSIKRFKETVLTLESDVFTLELEEITPAEPKADAIYKEICGKPQDATYKIENQRLVIIPEKYGVSFDIETAQTIIDSTEDDVITIPITSTAPEVTAETLNNSLFPDLLGTFSSNYNAGDRSRSYNVSLAAQKINGIVLAPGDGFSYNDIVGPRTTARGFRVANVYVGNRVEPGVGGGICQVSSTLFNAVVLSDLKVTKRTNHSLPVSYVPMGRDATVSYGSIDFCFKNSTNNIIKIVAFAENGVNKVSIYGTKENKNRTIEITTECTGSYGPKVVQKEDPSLPAGTVKVMQKGSSGSSYNAYKITKENGTVVKREFLAKSTYVGSERIELVGTGGQDPSIPVTGEEVYPEVMPPTPIMPDAPETTDAPETEAPSASSVPEETSSPTAEPEIDVPSPGEPSAAPASGEEVPAA